MTAVAPLEVGVAGLGTVGASVLRLLADRREALASRTGRTIEVAAVTARSKGKGRDVDLSGVRWVDDPATLARDAGIDVFVELMGGDGDPAKAAVDGCACGRQIGGHRQQGAARPTRRRARRARRAAQRCAEFRGGGRRRHSDRQDPARRHERQFVERVYGILNGTCNYILTRMERERLAFEVCLKEAQRLGYAEADPSFDIEGHDTAQKLAILASLAFGTRVDPAAVYVEGISSITLADLDAAEELGYRVKLLGVAVRTETGIEQRVHPTMVPKDSAIAQVMGVTNAITVDAAEIDPITLVGPGAGGMATASAVVSDIADIARGVRGAPFGRPTADLVASVKAPMQRHEGGYYIRLLARDRPGTAATIATRLAEQGISLESIVQRHRGARPQGGDVSGSQPRPVPVILITYATTEDAMRRRWRRSRPTG